MVFATPIHPDLKQLLKDAQRPQFQYMPARAGWNGPEAKPHSATLNPTYEKLKYTETSQALKNQIRSVVLPDGRALAALMFLILALRFVRMHKPQPAPVVVRGEVVTMPPRQDPAEQAA